MVGGVLGLYEAVKTLAPVLEAAAAAYIVFKAASLGGAAFAAIQSAGARAILAVTGFTNAVTAAGGPMNYLKSTATTTGGALLGQAAAAKAAAMNFDQAGVAAARSAGQMAAAGGAARIAASALAFLANPIVGMITTLGILGFTYWSTTNSAKEASQTLSDRVIENGKVNIAQWDEEIAKLKERAAIMNMGRYSEAQEVVNKAKVSRDTAHDSWLSAQRNLDNLDARTEAARTDPN